MSPVVDTLHSLENAIMGKAIERRDRASHQDLLPADFSAQVLAATRAEAGKIRAWVEKVTTELDRLRGELKTAEAAVKALYVPIQGPVKVTGDILTGDSRVERGPSTVSLRTDKALAVEKARVTPLRARITALEAEKSARERELWELRRVATLAGQGDVALISYLARGWSTRLLIGPSTIGRLPPPARALWAMAKTTPTDAAGVPLPPEALDAEGRPEVTVPMRGEPVRDTITRANTPAPVHPDDFSGIQGVGRASARAIVAAGVTTFAGLRTADLSRLGLADVVIAAIENWRRQ